MRILFPAFPLDPTSADPDYEIECASAKAAGFTVGLLDLEALNAGNVSKAVRRVGADGAEPVLYRGWMLTHEAYVSLDNALRAKQLSPVTAPDEYVACHHFPESYEVIRALTPESYWVSIENAFSEDTLSEVARRFGHSPLVIKDFVKSAKHYWNEACYVPDAADGRDLEKKVRRLIEIRDLELTGGIVFRRFEELLSVGTHPNSGMPISLEYRTFVLNGKPLATLPYWEGDYGEHPEPNLEDFESQLSRINSPFFTVDFACTQEGAWRIIELGDAQVAGLPEHADVSAFYTALAAKLISGPGR
ncbi:MAG: ATP-grasp domain-containing protein [Myxococcota bacterium]